MRCPIMDPAGGRRLVVICFVEVMVRHDLLPDQVLPPAERIDRRSGVPAFQMRDPGFLNRVVAIRRAAALKGRFQAGAVRGKR